MQTPDKTNLKNWIASRINMEVKGGCFALMGIESVCVVELVTFLLT